MPNIISGSWVKNVNNLRKSRGIYSVFISPIYKKSVRAVDVVYGKVRFIRHIIHTQTMSFSTSKNRLSSLLNIGYPHYPQGLLLELLKRN